MTTCTIVTSEVSVYQSKWLCAHLPIQYQIQSDKFPVNTFDDIDSVISIEESENGFSIVNLGTTYVTYVAKDKVKLSNQTNTAYNGIFKILSVVYPDQLIINAPYSGDSVGDFQKYYDNYNILVNVYCGFPVGHTYYDEKPISLLNETPIAYKPNPDNIAYVKVDQYIRTCINQIENELCSMLESDTDLIANDRNLWTALYIEYAESYDVSDGNTVSTFVSEFTGAYESTELFMDTEFAEGLYFWSVDTAPQGGVTYEWSDEADQAIVYNTGAGTAHSQIIGQQINFVAGRTYRVRAEFTKNGASNAIEFDASYYFWLRSAEIQIYTGSAVFESSNVVTFDYEPESSFTDYLDFQSFLWFGQRVTLTLFSVTEIGSVSADALFYASNSTQQNQYPFGNNMGEYVLNQNDLALPVKFMTLFEEPVLFEGYENDLSFILPSDLSLTYGLSLFWRELDANRTAITAYTEEVLNTYDEGVYRLLLNRIGYSASAKYLQLFLAQGSEDTRLTEIKVIKINSDCATSGTYLKWLNYLGGWDSWLFTGYKDTNVSFQDRKEIRRNTRNIWDSVFTQGTTEYDLTKLEPREGYVVRSQLLSDSELEGLIEMMQSIKVQQLSTVESFEPFECISQTKKTVIVEHSTTNWKNDKPGLNTLTFNLKSTFVKNVQTQ